MRQLLLSLVLKILRLGKSSVPLSKKGLVVIQIDGLGYADLQKAIGLNRAPFFGWLSQEKGFFLKPYFGVFPSVTTAAEAMLMYGGQTGVVGFSWYDRRLGRFVRAELGGKMNLVESSLERLGPPLFKDGSVILGAYSGGATLTALAAGTLNPDYPLPFLLKLRIVLVPLLNPIRFWRIVLFLLTHFFIQTFLLLKSRRWRQYRWNLEEVLLRVFLTDLVSLIATLDLWRQTPSLFVNFTLYDKMAHDYGPSHPLALAAAGLVSVYCRTIYQVSQRQKRKYDFLIISDHGQTPAVFFDDYVGQGLAEVVEQSLADPRYQVWVTFGTSLSENEIRDQRKVFIVPSCCLAQVYFSESLKSSYFKSDLETKFPHLFDHLIANRGVGWVLVRLNEDSQVLLAKSGQVVFSQGGVVETQGHPLQGLASPDLILSALAGFAREANNGDLVIFGAFAGETCVNFEPLVGAHGGFVGEMIQPFVITDNQAILALQEGLITGAELFGRLRKAHFRPSS